MKSLFVATAFTLAAGAAFMPGSAQAAGCLKGAVVGGVAGHVAGHHALLGAAAGCAVGHHYATKAAAAKQAPQNSKPNATNQ